MAFHVTEEAPDYALRLHAETVLGLAKASS